MQIIDEILNNCQKVELKVHRWSYNGFIWSTLLTPQQFEILSLMFHDQDADLAFQEYIFDVEWLPIALAKTSEESLNKLLVRLESHVSIERGDILKWFNAVTEAMHHMDIAFDEMQKNQQYIPKLKLLNKDWKKSVFVNQRLTPMSAAVFQSDD